MDFVGVVAAANGTVDVGRTTQQKATTSTGHLAVVIRSPLQLLFDFFTLLHLTIPLGLLSFGLLRSRAGALALLLLLVIFARLLEFLL